MKLITDFLNVIPAVLQAVFILLIAWIIASILRSTVRKILNRVLGTKVDAGTEEVKKSYRDTVAVAGDITFAVIFFLFLPSALEKLGMGSITSPIYEVVTRFLTFLPKIVAACILIAFGLFFAKLIAQIVDKLLKKTGLDTLQTKGGIEVKEGYEFSTIISKIVYALLVILFVVAGIQVLGIKAISDPAVEMTYTIFDYIPLLFIGIVLIAFGIFIGKLVGNLVKTILAGTGIDKFSKETYQNNNSEATPASSIIGGVVTTVIDIIFVVAGIKVLKIEVLTEVGNAIIGYLPSLLAAVLILLAAWAAASWLQKAVVKTYPDAKSLASIIRITILVLAGFMALGQLGISDDIVVTLFRWICIGLAAAFAIAFGKGGEEWAKKRLDNLTKSTEDQTKKKSE